jgi:hypothetical protein
MDYKYPPIYKYGLMMLLIFMYFKHQHIMTHDKILTNSIAITCFIAVLDYILIRNHPTPLETKNKEAKEKPDESFSNDDIEDIINSYDEESENDSDEEEMINPHTSPRMSSRNSRHNRKYY